MNRQVRSKLARIKKRISDDKRQRELGRGGSAGHMELGGGEPPLYLFDKSPRRRKRG